MQQMVLEKPDAEYSLREVPLPQPGPGEVLLKVSACAVCEIDLKLQEGEHYNQQYPLVPGHEVVGHVQAVGDGVSFTPGQRLGLGWLGGACGNCRYCKGSLEYLCTEVQHTGCDHQGGYASHVLADASYCHDMSDVQVAPIFFEDSDTNGWSEEAGMTPLLCEGALAYRSYMACGEAEMIGLYGFGTAAQLICQMAKADGRQVYAMTRSGGEPLLEIARSLGADWAGTTEHTPPALLDAAILLQPTVELVPHALTSVRKNGQLVFLGMHSSKVPSFPYDLFAYEHGIQSIARCSNKDTREFLARCARQTLKTRIRSYPFTEVNRAIRERRREHHGETVLVM